MCASAIPSSCSDHFCRGLTAARAYVGPGDRLLCLSSNRRQLLRAVVSAIRAEALVRLTYAGAPECGGPEIRCPGPPNRGLLAGICRNCEVGEVRSDPLTEDSLGCRDRHAEAQLPPGWLRPPDHRRFRERSHVRLRRSPAAGGRLERSLGSGPGATYLRQRATSPARQGKASSSPR